MMTVAITATDRTAGIDRSALKPPPVPVTTCRPVPLAPGGIRLKRRDEFDQFFASPCQPCHAM